MAQDRTLDHYEATITIDLEPMNKFGDSLTDKGEQELIIVKNIVAKNLTELGHVLAQIDNLGKTGPSTSVRGGP